MIDGNALKKQLEDTEAKRVAQENARRKAAWQHEKDLEIERQRTRQQTTDKARISVPLPPLQILDEYKPVFPQPVVIDDTMLNDLASERAARVQSLLTGKLGLNPAKVVVATEPRVTSEANNPGNRALISLNALAQAKGKTTVESSPAPNR